MHFSIPFTQDLVDSFGSRYVLYSLYLEGFLFCKVRYSDLHKWDEKLRRHFGSSVPVFPPKFYLAMTKSSIDERRVQLEQYLQKVGVNPAISSSELFIQYFKDLQMDTFRIKEHKADLDVYLPNGRKMRIDIQTSDTAERVLEIVSYKLELHRELIGYFSLFLSEQRNTVLKRVVEFELPYVTLYRMKDVNVSLEIRKWYMDPSLDKVLFDSQASVTLLCLQALQEIKRQWSRPTHEQFEKLESLEKAGNYIEFLELIQDVELYSYIQLVPCTIDYPEPDCEAVISVGKKEIHCSIQLSNNTTKEIAFKVDKMSSWQVTFREAEAEDGRRIRDERFELGLDYTHADPWKWITIYTKQAFLLSSCLQKMFSEDLLKRSKDILEMQIEVPDLTKVRKSSKLYQTVVPFGNTTEKSKISSLGHKISFFPEVDDDGL